MRRPRSESTARPFQRAATWWLAQLALLALAAFHLWKLLACLDGCYADIEDLFGWSVARLSVPDMRLNSWILAWMQRALTGAPVSMFDSNAFHPADSALTGSEHLLGISLLLLPTSPLGPSGVQLHQLATLLSFLIMGWTTFALVRWLTGSDWAAFVAAAMAMFMPWRIFDLARLQLLSAHWFPLIWLLIGKLVTGEAGRRTAPLLALVLFLQLASSYYLAYYVTASIAVLVPLLVLRHAWRSRDLARLAAALVAAYVPFVLISLPYLQREVSADLVLMGVASLQTALGDVLAAMTGRTPGLEGTRLTYHVPLGVLAFALLGAALALLPRARADEGLRRLRSFTLAFWLIVLMAQVFLLGNQLRVGEGVVDLPGRLASEWIPGFRHLRAPSRWFILVGIAAPLLAALGVHLAERMLDGIARARRAVALPVFRLAVLLFVSFGMSREIIPVRATGLEKTIGTYEALRDLPDGPVLEVPWPVTRLREADTGSRYMLGSTVHWKPILNGFSPYPPRTYGLLHRLGWRLPGDEDALDKLTRLAGLRWIVVHLEPLREPQRRQWELLVSRGFLRKVYDGSEAWILEVVDRAHAGAWLAEFKSPVPRERTFTGLSREPIVSAGKSSRLEIGVPPVMRHGAGREVMVELVARVTNDTGRPWPGLDLQTEGLVQLGYRFVAPDGTRARDGAIPFDGDVPAHGSLEARILLQPPEEPGNYRVRFTLVQDRADGRVELAVPAIERDVTVRASRGRARPASRALPTPGSD